MMLLQNRIKPESDSAGLLRFGCIAAVLILHCMLSAPLQSAEPRKRSIRSQFTIKGHRAAVVCVAFSPTGHTLATSSHDETIKMWDSTSGKLKATIPGKFGLIVFSPDGKTLAVGHDKAVELLDARTGAVKKRDRSHADGAHTMAFSPDGKFLASAGDDLAIHLWNLRTGEIRLLKGHKERISSLAFSPTKPLLFSGGGSFELTFDDSFEPGGGSFEISGGGSFGRRRPVELKLWDIVKGKRLIAGFRGQRGHLDEVAISPNGKLAASAAGDGTIAIWDFVNCWKKHTLTYSKNGSEATEAENGDMIIGRETIAFAPDGKTLVSGGTKDGRIVFWDVRTGKRTATLRGHKAPVYSIAFSPDGKQLATASADHSAKVWRYPLRQRAPRTGR